MNFVLKFERELTDEEQCLVSQVMAQVDKQLEGREMIPWESVAAEMDRQVEFWGKQMHPDHVWLLILMEEVGEVAQLILQCHDEEVEEEVVQCAAVALSWLECLVRRQEEVEAPF